MPGVPKTPIQIRLDDAELAALDAQRATEGRFPPERPTVVKRALMEWLAQQHTARRVPPPPPSPPPAADATMEGGPPPPPAFATDEDAAAKERERKRKNTADYRARKKAGKTAV